MNKTLKTVLITLLVLVVAGGLFFTGQAYSRWNSASFYGDGWMPMMNGRGAGYGPTSNGRGNGYGPSMMGNGRGNGYGPMMGNGYGGAANAQPLTIEEAKTAAQNYIDSLNISGLELGEVMVFDNNAYVVVKEEATGMGAFELLINSGSNVAYPEHGPNMMWNLKYGGLNHQNMMGGGYGFMAGGMMGRGYFNGDVTNVSADMPVTKEEAVQNAQAYLDQYIPGAKVEEDGTAFYGYYTFDFSKDDKIAGMLSVNGYSGQAFYHTWHGTFIEESGME